MIFTSKKGAKYDLMFKQYKTIQEINYDNTYVDFLSDSEERNLYKLPLEGMTEDDYQLIRINIRSLSGSTKRVYAHVSADAPKKLNDYEFDTYKSVDNYKQEELIITRREIKQFQKLGNESLFISVTGGSTGAYTYKCEYTKKLLQDLEHS